MSNRQKNYETPEPIPQGKNTWPIAHTFLQAFLPSYCHYRQQQHLLALCMGGTTHSAETQWHSRGKRRQPIRVREQKRKPPLPFWSSPAVAQVLTAIAVWRGCSCAGDMASRNTDKRPLPGSPGVETSPEQGDRSLCLPCPRPCMGWPHAGTSRCQLSREPGAASPLWGIFTRKAPAARFVLSNTRSQLYS